MGIQERLKRQRYGEHHVIMPNKDEISYIKTSRNLRYALKSDDIYNKVFQLFLTPPVKDRYFKNYITVIKDYKHYAGDLNSNRGFTFIVEQILIKKMVYFLHNKQMYSHNFEVYSQSWLFGALCSMRKYVMKQLMKENKIPVLYDLNNPASNGYYKLVKPMNNRAMKALGSRMFDLLYPYVKEYYVDGVK